MYALYALLTQYQCLYDYWTNYRSTRFTINSVINLAVSEAKQAWEQGLRERLL